MAKFPAKFSVLIPKYSMHNLPIPDSASESHQFDAHPELTGLADPQLRTADPSQSVISALKQI